MTKEEAILFVNSCKWSEAKSYSKTFPHFYTTRTKVSDNEMFEKFLRYVRDNSIMKKFYSKQYLYLELEGFEYWDMGRPMKAVQVLNKAMIDDSKQYRFPMPTVYDEQILKQKLDNRDKYLESLLKLEQPTFIELTHIEFLMNTERRIHGGGKNIIDHSSLEIKYQ